LTKSQVRNAVQVACDSETVLKACAQLHLCPLFISFAANDVLFDALWLQGNEDFRQGSERSATMVDFDNYSLSSPIEAIKYQPVW
jgi:hypothetical protein